MSTEIKRATPEIFAVIWHDNMFGPLTLTTKTPDAAIEKAADMRVRGAGKITGCRAVRIPANEFTVEYLD